MAAGRAAPALRFGPSLRVRALADPDVALVWVRTLTGLAIALSSAEVLCLARELRPGGLYFDRPSTGAVAARPWPARPSLFLGLMVARLVLALVVAAGFDGPRGRPAILALLALLSLVMHRRLRYGLSGADPMMGILALALALGSLRPDDARVQTATMWFVALQGVIAYTSAGITKLRIPEWRAGTYLRKALGSATVGHPVASRLLGFPGVSVAATWGVLAWELAFPLSLVSGVKGALAFCAAGVAFHLMIAVFSGLKMFVLIFAATYPAIVCGAAQVAAWLRA
jgi:hypothetical protein